MSNIKQELERIQIPKELHERSKLGVKKAKSEQPKRKLTTLWVAAVMISVLGIGSLASPSVQATIENLFSFNQVEEMSQTNIGWTWGGIAGNDATIYSSVDEIEKKYSMDIPFPEQLHVAEENSSVKEYTVNTSKDKFVSYNYYLRTEDRMYRITATNVSKEKPEFTANTTQGTVIEKEISINGMSGTLIGIQDINGYHIYIEQGDWKIVVSGFADFLDGKKGAPELTEKEIITIAESIK
ncbi:hypothetical protein MHH33_12760 [Paenisporosarcina sp. FSL H8-0542]|uniref:hypothetical protein n=1 Tax=Paenisporosarcina sp. FSL H8-0542 TaxID=2921401 RepID=UPI003159CCD3